VAYNLSSTGSDLLKGLFTDFVYNYSSSEWAKKVGINVDLNPKIKGYLDEILKYTLNKYDSYSSSVALRATDIQRIIRYISSAVFTDGASMTYTVIDGGNFTAVSIQDITNLIKFYLINIVAFDWLLKLGDNSAPIYNKEAQINLAELNKYSERKRDIVDTELGRAAYRVYDNFSFSGKSLVRPVLYNESYAYALQESISDGVNTFDISEQTVDATGKIYYWFLMHGYWETSHQYALDSQIEEALISYVLREYYKNKPEFQQNYAMVEKRFAELISSIRMTLYSRQKSHATRRGTSFL
jgi:hypothetical protein